MLQLYDVNHNKIAGLTNYKDYNILREINQLDILSYLYPITDKNHDSILHECYIRTKDNEYVVKEVNYSDENYNQYVCKVNIEGIQGNPVSNFEAVEQLCADSVNLALVGTGWTVGSCDVVKLRTVKKNNCTAYDVLQDIQTAYGCEMTFDAINKQVNIYQAMGSDKGTYFAEQLNLKKLDTQSNSYDYVTRIIPHGKDGLDIKSINNDIEYVENYQYSSKIITAYWEDNRYTVAQDLLDDAIVRLDYLSKPLKSYKADVYDLANNSDKYKKILDYSLGDTITLLAKSKNTKEKQRIVKLTQYPDEPERNTVEIANKIASLDVLNVRFQGTSDTVDSVTTSDGGLDGSKVDGIDWTQLQNVHIMVADIQDMSVVTARIGTLETTTAHITNGVIDNATIDVAKVNNLSSTYATIANLTVTNGNITSLQSSVASINNVLAGNVGANNLAAGAIQAGSAVIANSAISSAQIISLDVAKLNAGIISTTKFTLQSDSGNMFMSDNTIQIKDANRVRVQIGKDASADYNMYVWDASGNLMFDATGIHANGIKSAIIVDSMVSSSANINGSKIEKESLVTQINGATTTLKSSKIYLDTQAQTLDVAFTSLSSTVTSQGNTVSSQGTSISTIQGQISSKIWTTDITTAVNNIQVGGRNLLLNSNFSKGVSTNWTLTQSGAGTIASVVTDSTYGYCLKTSKMYNLGTAITTGTIKTGDNVTMSFVAKSDVAGTENIYLTNNDTSKKISSELAYSTTTSWQKFSFTFTALHDGDGSQQLYVYGTNSDTNCLYITNIKIESGTKATTWTPAPEDVQSQIDSATTRITNTETSITQLNSSITLKANQTDLTTTNSNVTTAQNTANTAVTNASSAQTTANSANTLAGTKRRVFTSTPTIPYDVGDLWISTTTSGNNMICTTARATGSYTTSDWVQDSVTQRMTAAEASITVNASNIALKASQTDLTTLSNNLANNYSTTSQMNSAIQVSASSITSSVASTYATINTVNGKVDTATYNSYVSQTATTLSSKVNSTDFNGNNLVSLINQSSSKISMSALNIDLSGYVTISSLGSAGAVTINGGNITAGTITADKISGGTLNIGKASNSSGTLLVWDSTGIPICSMDNGGIHSGYWGGGYHWSIVNNPNDPAYTGASIYGCTTFNNSTHFTAPVQFDSSITGSMSVNGSISATGGLDVNNISWGSSADMSGGNFCSLTTGGAYRGQSMSNSPNGSADWFHIIALEHDANWVFHLANDFFNDNYLYFRNMYNGIWQPWRSLAVEGMLGRKPAWSWSGSLGNGATVVLTHNLGYAPIVCMAGTVGNVNPTYAYNGGNSIQICNWNSAGNTWNGAVYLW